jgi:hypothetical protein
MAASETKVVARRCKMPAREGHGVEELAGDEARRYIK